jgi:hypothetical protein
MPLGNLSVAEQGMPPGFSELAIIMRKDTSMTLNRVDPGKMRAAICAMLFSALVCSTAVAHETWSADPDSDAGNCAECHGKFGFVGTKYLSRHDGTVWSGDLMTGHGSSTLTGCMECHLIEGDQPAISRCAGCHGREEDGGAMQTGMGLVQHHRVKGITDCDACHMSGGTIAGEDVVPAKMLVKGIDPCNDAQFGPDGLDNDGDGLYDSDDPDCQKISQGEDEGVKQSK